MEAEASPRPPLITLRVRLTTSSRQFDVHLYNYKKELSMDDERHITNPAIAELCITRHLARQPAEKIVPLRCAASRPLPAGPVRHEYILPPRGLDL